MAGTTLKPSLMHIVNKVELVYQSIVGSPIDRDPSHLFGRGYEVQQKYARYSKNPTRY